jgi:hypothetical protein
MMNQTQMLHPNSTEFGYHAVGPAAPAAAEGVGVANQPQMPRLNRTEAGYHAAGLAAAAEVVSVANETRVILPNSAESCYHLPGLAAAEGEKLCETELRFRNRLSQLEIALSTSTESEDEQLHTIRKHHSKNMAELEMIHRKLLHHFSVCDLDSEQASDTASAMSCRLQAPMDEARREGVLAGVVPASSKELATGVDLEASAGSGLPHYTTNAVSSTLGDDACISIDSSDSKLICMNGPAGLYGPTEVEDALVEFQHGVAELLTAVEDVIPAEEAISHAAEASSSDEILQSPGAADHQAATSIVNMSLESHLDVSELSSTVDAAIQTELVPPHRHTVQSLLHSSANVVSLASRCPKASPNIAADRPTASPSQWSNVDTTADLWETQLMDADSETSSVATTVVPRKLQFKQKWSDHLDVETQRIARIMRGSAWAGDDSDGSSSTSSD